MFTAFHFVQSQMQQTITALQWQEYLSFPPLNSVTERDGTCIAYADELYGHQPSYCSSSYICGYATVRIRKIGDKVPMVAVNISETWYHDAWPICSLMIEHHIRLQPQLRLPLLSLPLTNAGLSLRGWILDLGEGAAMPLIGQLL